MRYVIAILCIALPLMAWANQSSMEPNKQLLVELQLKAKQIQSISSHFSQEKHLEMFDEVLVSKGRFAFQKPASLRWEYLEPFRAGFLLNDGTGKEWDEASDNERNFTLESSPAMSMVASQIMAWTTFDIEWLESRYTIQLTDTTPVTLELCPRGDAAKEFLKYLTVTFSADNRTISLLELHETDGDFTRISFDNPRINDILAEKTFTAVR
ncbi:MAG: outer membrane lipoprotein carrier protein LolA [Pseudodesulfovibrio sp.]|nr:outer membrane lipoprotein carrier protein LolA [Pseudodesulfovibrio sp.]